jgi:hypothetical protein
MFITIGTATQHISDAAGEALMATGLGMLATAHEAADLISQLVVRGDSGMHAANEEFKTTFRKGK